MTCAKLDALGLVLCRLIVLHHLLQHPTGRSTSADLFVTPSAFSWHWAGYEKCSVNPCGYRKEWPATAINARVILSVGYTAPMRLAAKSGLS